MIESMKFWLETSDIDGFRCDVADWVPIGFGKSRVELESKKCFYVSRGRKSRGT